MKKTILFLLLSGILLFSCTLDNKKPEFRRIENLEVKSLNTILTEITADVVVYNPNGVSAKLNTMEIDVFANELKLTHISQTNNISIAKKTEFIVPLKANMNLMDLIKNESSIINLINSGLSGFTEKKIDLNFVGTAEFEVAGLKLDIPISHKEVIELNK